MSVIATGPSGGLYVKSLTDVIGIGATINADGSFNAATGPEIRRVTGSPNGVVSDRGGSLALDVTNGLVYLNKSTGNAVGTVWAVLASTVVPGANAAVRLFSLTTPAQDFADSTSGVQLFAAGQVAIPANTLTAGSVIRVRLAGNLNQAGAGTVALGLQLGAAPTSIVSSANFNFGNNNSVVADFSCTIRAAGAAVGTLGSIVGALGATPIANQSPAGANLNTTITNTLSLTVNFSAAAPGTNIDINEYEVVLFP